MRSALMDALGEVEKDDYAPGLEGARRRETRASRSSPVR